MWLICQQYAEGRGGKSLSLSLVCSFSSWIVCVRACAHVCAHGARANGVAVVGLLCDTQGTGFAHCLALLLPHRLQCQVAWSCALPREGGHWSSGSQGHSHKGEGNGGDSRTGVAWQRKAPSSSGPVAPCGTALPTGVSPQCFAAMQL